MPVSIFFALLVNKIFTKIIFKKGVRIVPPLVYKTPIFKAFEIEKRIPIPRKRPGINALRGGTIRTFCFRPICVKIYSQQGTQALEAE